MNCPLCESPECRAFEQDKRRTYIRCNRCELIFVPPEYHIGLDEEIQRYGLHDNSANNQGYVRYLNELADLINDTCGHDIRVLDFGSGKNAVLAGILRQRGFNCDAYDPLYGIGDDALVKTYDVIILCEVIEHLRDLKSELCRICGAMEPNGTIVIRTQPYVSPDTFSGWWYKNDPTHINFFNSRTIDTLGSITEFREVRRIAKDIFVCTRHGT